MTSGDIGYLQSGTYTESLVLDTDGVTLQAADEGGVLIDGEGARIPVTVSGDNVTVAGINAANSSGNVWHVTGNNVTIQRCIGWNSANGGNSHVWGVSAGTNILIEDCAGFGISRKTFSISSGATYVTARRCFGIWEGYEASGPTMTFTCAYDTYHCVWDFCIAMWDRKFGAAPVEPYGCFGTDGASPDNDTYNVLQNSIALVRASDVFDPAQAVLLTGINHFTCVNSVAIMIESALDRTIVLGSTVDRLDNVIQQFAAIGPTDNPGYGAGDPGYWAQASCLEGATIDDVYPGESAWNNTTGSAQLDSSVYLAWPMRQRIIDAMTNAGYTAENIIDVHAELIAAFGVA